MCFGLHISILYVVCGQFDRINAAQVVAVEFVLQMLQLISKMRILDTFNIIDN